MCATVIQSNFLGVVVVTEPGEKKLSPINVRFTHRSIQNTQFSDTKSGNIHPDNFDLNAFHSLKLRSKLLGEKF